MTPGTLHAVRGALLDASRDADRWAGAALVGLLGYDTKPDTMSSELLKLVRYGRRGAVACELGEAFVGSGPNAAHVNTCSAPRDGPVGAAWATALATPSAGHAPFVVVLHPGLPVKP